MPKHFASLGLAISARIVSGLLIFKFLAYAFGPDRFGVLSHIFGTAMIFYAVAGPGMVTGVTRLVAGEVDPDRQAAWLKNAGLAVSLVSGAVAAVALALFLFGARHVFADAVLAPVLIVIAIGQFLIAMGAVILAFMVGAGNVRAFVVAHTAGSLSTVLAVVVVARLWGFDGAVYVTALLPLAPSLIAFVQLWRSSWRPRLRRTRIDRAMMRAIVGYSAATLVAISAVPVAQFFVRIDLADRLGWETVGHWQAVVRISESYMQAVAVLLLNLLLPALTRAPDPRSRLATFLRLGAFFAAIFIAGGLVFYLFRGPILAITYSSDFVVAGRYVLPQLAGDFARLLFLMIAYFFIARGRAWPLALAEVTQAALLLLAYRQFVPGFGGDAPALAYAVSAWSVLLLMILLMVRQVRRVLVPA